MTVRNYINHVALVLDASGSMGGHARTLIRVTDNLIRDLALASEEKKQETRVSIYSFDDVVKNLVFDMDVMRLPSIADLYRIGGMTALIDGVMQAQVDLATTSQIYGEHGFLTYVLTDGMENRSRLFQMGDLAAHLQHGMLPSRRIAGRTMLSGDAGLRNASVAFLVPDAGGRAYVERLGAAPGNVLEWDTGTEKGVLDVGERIKTATTAYMDGRTRGVVRSASVFDTSAATVNTASVQAALTPLAGDKFRLIPVAIDTEKIRVDAFIRDVCGMEFRLGTVYYQWNKRETVQPQKRLAVVNKKTDQVFVGSGDEVRQMIGLPSLTIRDLPKGNPDWIIFVQSTAPNRNLVAHTKALVMM